MVATSTPHSAVMCLRRGDYEADMHKLPEGEKVCKEDVGRSGERTAFSNQQMLFLPTRRAGPRGAWGEPASGTSPQSTEIWESWNGRCALAIFFSFLNDFIIMNDGKWRSSCSEGTLASLSSLA